MWILTALVDLVHGDRRDAERQRGGAREHDASAVEQLLDEQARNDCPLPLPQRIARAPWSCEDVARVSDRRHELFVGETGLLDAGLRVGRHPGDCDRCLKALAEVGDRTPGDLPSVLLEAERGVEQDCWHRWWPQSLEQLAMDLHHRRRRLARAHDREQTGYRRTCAHRSLGCGVPSQRNPPGGSPQ